MRLFSDDPKIEVRIVKVLAVPDKFNFKIKEIFTSNGYVVALINFPDCITFKGDKVIVWDRSVALEEIRDATSIDPHFLESNRIVLRIRPCENWKEIVVHLCNSLPKGEKHLPFYKVW